MAKKKNPRLTNVKAKTITNTLTGEKWKYEKGKKILLERRDPKKRFIHINELTGESYIYVGGKKRILEKVDKKKLIKNKEKNK